MVIHNTAPHINAFEQFFLYITLSVFYHGGNIVLSLIRFPAGHWQIPILIMFLIFDNGLDFSDKFK